LADGLRSNGSIVVISTQAHREALERNLVAQGFDIVGARLIGRYVALDAGEVLAHVMVNGSPSAQRFAEIIGGALQRARAAGRHVWVVRGMVPLLWGTGQHQVALRLQELWDGQTSGDGLSIFTAFPAKNLAGQDNR